MSTKTRRIAKEIKDVHEDPKCHVTVKTVGEDLTNLIGTFTGPPDTPYEEGKYEVEIRMPPEYPFKPPEMRFITKIWHPNISSQTGAICLDTLKQGWTPVLGIKTALLSLQSLLAAPEPKDPQDAVVASQMISRPEDFKHKAREWAIKYAGAPAYDFSGGSGGATAESLAEKGRKRKEEEQKASMAQYRGYNKDMINRFVAMGFELPRVVAAFEYFGIDRNGGRDYELEEAYMGDITARLLGED